VTVYKPDRCRSYDSITDLPCQGRRGHAGDHWAYSASGWYCYWVRRRDRKARGNVAAGQVPPGHASWPSPANMTDEACGFPLLDRFARNKGRKRDKRRS
jgi:hypothetical protein